MEFQEFSQLTLSQILEAHTKAERKRHDALLRRNVRPRPNRKKTRFGFWDVFIVLICVSLVGLSLYL